MMVHGSETPDKTPRRTIPRRLRYEILRRDNYACRYCGGAAPDVKLTVDHVVPVVLGGTDDPTNLATACADCNSGKTSTSPDAPVVADVASDALRWAAAMKESQEARQVARERRQSTQEQLVAWFGGVWRDELRSDIDLPDDPFPSLIQFVEAGLTAGDLVEAVTVAGRGYRKDYWRYFCGVCWGMVRETQDTARAILEREEV